MVYIFISSSALNVYNHRTVVFLTKLCEANIKILIFILFSLLIQDQGINFKERHLMIDRFAKEKQQQQPKWRYTTAKKVPQHRENEISTTPRKQPYHQGRDRRRNKSITRNKAGIQQLYQKLMEQSQYTQAQKVHAQIKFINHQQKQRRSRILSQEHSKQKQIVKLAHKNQMAGFRQAWNQLFIRQQADYRNMLQKLAQLRAADEEKCRQRIVRRCQSAKPVDKIAKLYELQDCERILRKRGKTVQLKKLRSQKKKLIQSCRREHERNCTVIAEQEQKHLIEKQTRRYNSFMDRIEHTKKDNERLYRREQYRLKQKYKNILKNLEHEQKLSFQRF